MDTQFNVDVTAYSQPPGQIQRELILEELSRILGHPEFSGSKRCVILLRHLVNSALAGKVNDFKERTLGFEVFGRSSDYDCQSDPIVRMTANEIRKRLGQYYSERQDPQPSVRIKLARGTYIPQFEFKEPSFVETKDSVAVSETSLLSHPTVRSADLERSTKPSKRSALNLKRASLISAALAILAIAVVAAFHQFRLVQPLDAFWSPFLHSNQPISICVADDPTLVVSADDLRAVGDSSANSPVSTEVLPATPFMEATSANMIANWFSARQKEVFFQRASTGALHIFSKSPAVFIGSFDNPWSLMLTSNLRYRMHIDLPTHERWIEDSHNPSNRDWRVGVGLRFNDSYTDYVLISRFWSSETRNWILVISSLGPHGSRAATELITDSSLLKSLPVDFGSNTNMQIVLKTAVIKGNTEGPQVLASYKW